MHSRLLSEDGDLELSVRGDAAAARSVLERFRSCVESGGVGGAQPSDWDVLRAVDELVARMLSRTDSDLRIALGYQHLRMKDADRVLGALVHSSVDHAMFNMGALRTERDACAMVSQAASRMGDVFAQGLAADRVGEIYRAARASDPLGRPSM
jgi:hypothetical protein